MAEDIWNSNSLGLLLGGEEEVELILVELLENKYEYELISMSM